MDSSLDVERLRNRAAPLAMTPGDFREIGHRLVDQIADLLANLPSRPVTPAESPEEVRRLIGSDRPLPDSEEDASRLLSHTTELLFDHSLFNGHPRFLGYISSSAAPIGILGDFLAAAVNPNVGGWELSPLASEIEAQTTRWIAELIGYRTDCGGLLVSGGNMANFVGFLAARTAKADWNVRKTGLKSPSGQRLRSYASKETHTWIQKAADLCGLGTDSIRWIPTDQQRRLNTSALREEIENDRKQGDLPFLAVGTAGSVGTGAVDPLEEIAAVCREHSVWFHVDGAYGAVAAQVPGASPELGGLSEADSIAVDPHKWLYAPLEAGCALVRNAEDLRNTFSYHPPYYHLEKEGINYFEFGFQNSRGFRALKVWLALRQVGRAGYLRTIADDMVLAGQLHRLVSAHPELEALTHNLSITTFRYVPPDLRPEIGSEHTEAYLNRLNEELLTRIEKSGEAFLSNALIEGRFALRACIVNFRTSLQDIEALPGFIARLGEQTDTALRNE